MNKAVLIFGVFALAIFSLWMQGGAVPEQALIDADNQTTETRTQSTAPGLRQIRVAVAEKSTPRKPVPAKLETVRPHAGKSVPFKIETQTRVASASKPARTPVNQQTRKIIPARSLPASSNLPVHKCMNLGGALEAPHEGDWGYRIKNADLRLIARSGFDTIRLPVKWSAHTQRTAPYTINPALLRRTDEIVRTAMNSGLKVILDVHHYDDFMQNPDGEMPRLRAIWQQLSAHYADWPDGLIFEILNEVNGKVTVTKSNQINKDLLSLIRIKNPNRWVVLGSGNWGSIDPLLPDAGEKFQPPRDTRVINSFHYYDDFNFTHQGAPFLDNPPTVGTRFGAQHQKAQIALHMRQAREFKDRTGQPLLIGEFGVYRGVPVAERAKWAKYVRQQADAQGLGWCYWDWATEFKAFDPATGRMVSGFQDALLGK